MLLSSLLHRLFCRKSVRKFVDLLYPERVLWIHLAGSGSLPISRKPAGSLPVLNTHNLVSLSEKVLAAEISVSESKRRPRPVTLSGLEEKG